MDARPSKTYTQKGARGARVLYPEMERQLREWVTEMRRNKSRCKSFYFIFIYYFTHTNFYSFTGVTTQCLLIISGRLEPRLVGERSEAAALELLHYFRQRH